MFLIINTIPHLLNTTAAVTILTALFTHPKTVKSVLKHYLNRELTEKLPNDII